jgi:hypothetical protein
MRLHQLGHMSLSGRTLDSSKARLPGSDSRSTHQVIARVLGQTDPLHRGPQARWCARGVGLTTRRAASKGVLRARGVWQYMGIGEPLTGTRDLLLTASSHMVISQSQAG